MINKKQKIYLDDEIKAIESQIEQSKSVLDNMKEKTFFKSKEIGQKKFLLQKRIQELEEKRETLETKKDENLSLYSEIKNIESKMVELSFQQKSNEKSDSRLEERREQLEEIIDKLNTTLFQKSQLEFESNSKNDLIKIIEKNIFDEQQKLTQTQSEVMALEAQLQAKRLEVDTWVKTSKAVASSLTVNKETIETIGQEIKAKEAFLSKAQKIIEKMKEQEQKSEQKSEEMQDYHETLSQSVLASQKHNQEIQNKIQADETIILDLKNRIRDLSKEQKSNEREANKLEMKGRKVKTAKTELSQQNSELESQVDKQSTLLEEYSKEIQRLETQAETLHVNIKEQKVLMSQRTRDCVQQKEKIHRIKSQLQSDVKIYNLLRGKNDALEVENMKNEKDILSLEQKASKLNQAITFEQDRFKETNKSSTKTLTQKRALELSVDEKIIESETHKRTQQRKATRRPQIEI